LIPAYSPQAGGRGERNFRTWQERLPQELRLHGIREVAAAIEFLREHYIVEFNVFSLQHERTVNQDNTMQDQSVRSADREESLASHVGRMPRDRRSALGWNLECRLRPPCAGALQPERTTCSSTSCRKAKLSESGLATLPSLSKTQHHNQTPKQKRTLTCYENLLTC